MTKEELEKYTVDFMNNEIGSKYSNINSVLGKILIKYAEVFQKRIADLEKDNAELTRINDNLEEDRLAHIELEELFRL